MIVCDGARGDPFRAYVHILAAYFDVYSPTIASDFFGTLDDRFRKEENFVCGFLMTQN